MGQLLRITYETKDYNYQVVNEKPIGKETEEIRILLEGQSVILKKNDGRWVPDQMAGEVDEGLLKAIGKAISLRYRI
ncbi:hypothetical protein SAMN05216464_115108 [Mucilaginibacter pineti]|uniref:Uncharacterized protein n=1 Tax=Mucilaginibacter pineti TaxID=1391627 RepID=A0A1G7JT57_9SPHI|nr:hypothetical protein [Mucilaginibacter pineti]SDF28120.1 hypothetical protein SAMN05216464_115108 [Mucilaginibacter pineti]